MKEESVIWEGSKMLESTTPGFLKNFWSLNAKTMKCKRAYQYV